MLSSENLKATDWEVRTVPLVVAQLLVKEYHYSGGGANTATYRHGLFRKNEDRCFGVAWWIPPTKSAAKATYPANWRKVLALTRLAIAPDVPRNGASFLLGASMRLIDRKRWPCLVTYADEMQGHTGAIYRATNWQYCGMTAKEATFLKDGRMVARKAGPKTRTQQEMLDMGCELVGRFAKHKFRHIVELKRVCPICGFDIKDGESRKYWESADRRRRGYIHRYCDPMHVGKDPAVVQALAAHVDPGPYSGDPDL